MQKGNSCIHSKGKLPTVCEQPQLAQYFQRQKITSMLMSDYDRAHKYNELKNQFSEACALYDIKDNIANYLEEVERKINSTEDSSTKCTANWNKKMQDFKIDCLYKLDDLKIKHLAEIEKFNDYWTSDNVVNRYSSPSSTLRDLYNQETKFIDFKDYNQASIIRSRRKEQEKKETEAAQNQLISDAKVKLEVLRKKHQYELDRLEAYYIEGVTNLKLKKEKEELLFEKRLTKLKKDRENPVNRAPLPQSWRFSEMGTQIPMAVTTPRTRVKLANFKKSKQITKLEIKGITSRPATSLQRVRLSY